MKNPNRKGKIGEREFAAVLRGAGFDARRGRQFCGSPDSPDVVCPALAWLHVEVKREQRMNLASACEQAARDSGGRPFIVAHRRNRSPWLITARATTFLAMLREISGKMPQNVCLVRFPKSSKTQHNAVKSHKSMAKQSRKLTLHNVLA